MDQYPILFYDEDTLVASKDNQMLNDIYFEDELLDFRLGTRPRAPCWATSAQSQDEEPAKLVEHPEAPSISKDRIQQLFDKVDTLFMQQQQLQSQFQTFQ